MAVTATFAYKKNKKKDGAKGRRGDFHPHDDEDQVAVRL